MLSHPRVMLGGLALGLWLALCIAGARLASGETELSSPLVLLVRTAAPRSWPEAERRLVAELRAAGFEVREVRGAAMDESEVLDELRTEVSRYSALAAVRMQRVRNQGVRLWVEDAFTGKTVLRRISAAQLAGPDQVSVVVFRVVELLQASFLESRSKRHAAGAVPPAVSQMVSDALLEPSQPWRLGLGAGALTLGGNATALWVGAALSGDVSWLRITGALAFTPLPARLTHAAGHVDLSVLDARFLLTVPVLGQGPSLFLGAGAGAVSIWSEGHGPVGTVSVTDRIVALQAIVRAGTEFRLSDSVWLQGAIDVGVPFPKIAIYFSEQRTGLAPLLGLSGGVAWGF